MLIYKIDNLIDLDEQEVVDNLNAVISNKFSNIITMKIQLTPITILNDDNAHYFMVINCQFDAVTVTAEESDLKKLDELIKLTFKSQYELSSLVKLNAE